MSGRAVRSGPGSGWRAPSPGRERRRRALDPLRGLRAAGPGPLRPQRVAARASAGHPRAAARPSPGRRGDPDPKGGAPAPPRGSIGAVSKAALGTKLLATLRFSSQRAASRLASATAFGCAASRHRAAPSAASASDVRRSASAAWTPSETATATAARRRGRSGWMVRRPPSDSGMLTARPRVFPSPGTPPAGCYERPPPMASHSNARSRSGAAHPPWRRAAVAGLALLLPGRWRWRVANRPAALRAAAGSDPGGARAPRLPRAEMGDSVSVDPLFRVSFGPLSLRAERSGAPPVLRADHVKVRRQLDSAPRRPARAGLGAALRRTASRQGSGWASSRAARGADAAQAGPQGPRSRAARPGAARLARDPPARRASSPSGPAGAATSSGRSTCP